MADLLLLAGLPENITGQIREAAGDAACGILVAGTREECREVLLNAEVVALIIDVRMAEKDAQLLDVLGVYSDKVQVILYSEQDPPGAEWSRMKSVVGLLKGPSLDRSAFLACLNHAVRFHALARDRNYNESIISSIAYGLMITDTGGALLMMNGIGRKIFGVTAADVHGARVGTVVYEELRESLNANAQEVLKSGATRQVEGLSVREDLIISYSVSLIRDHFKNPVGLLFLGRDVTEWNQMAHLLFQAEKLATMGTMLSGIAHELRNPVTIINARAQRLLSAEKEALSEKQFKAVESIESQSRRCGEIINSLLDFSRKKVAGFVLADINEVIESALRFLEYDKRFEGIEVVRHFRGNCLALCDRSQMEQVFLNLCANACDAMTRGGKLFLATENHENYVKISVRDTGVGIPEEHRKKIFDPFFTTKEAGKGTGLGLAIVYKSVQMHKGRLVVRSKVGEGTTFTILLPKA